MYPDRPVTQQEAMVILARTLNLEDKAAALNSFTDGATVSNWAKGPVGAMIAAGYVSGNNGYINPKDAVTRAQFAQIMANITKTYLTSAQVYSTDVNGSVIISVPGVTLQDMTVSGDVILADGVGSGDATLSNVTVNGRLVVRGGGSNSIHIRDSRVNSGVALNNPSGATRLILSDSVISGSMSVFSDLTLEGNVTNLALHNRVVLNIQSGTISNLHIENSGAASSVTVAAGAAVTSATVKGAKTAISGAGKVGTVNASANNVAISTAGTIVVTAPGVTGTTAGGMAVEGGTSVITNSTGGGHSPAASGSSSGSSSDSGSSDNDPDYKNGFAGGRGTVSSPWQINTAAQLNRVRENLAAHYELTANIDLSGYANWVPIGQYVPTDAATGDVSARLGLAFTGSFDGNGHTISNLNISCIVDERAAAEDMTGTGLFGGLAGTAHIHDLIIKNATVSSNSNCTAALVGMAMSTPGQSPVRIANIALTGNNTISGVSAVGGLVGSSQDIDIVNCSAAANVIMTSAGNGAGILGGGLEGGSIVNCTATGTVTATATMDYAGTIYGSVGVGGLAGCAFDSTEVSGCTVTNATISVGQNSIMIGGLLGYSGVVNEGNYTSDEEGFTVIKDSEVTGITINAAPGVNRIGGIVGSGFCGPMYNSYYPASSAIHLVNCKAGGTIMGADADAVVGSILGYAFRNSAVVSCTGNITGAGNQVGAADAAQAAAIDQLEAPVSVSGRMMQAASVFGQSENGEALSSQQYFYGVQSLNAGSAFDAGNTFDGGDGTAANPYRISTTDQLYQVRNDLAAHYQLAADIDLASSEAYRDNWVPIGRYVPTDADSGDVSPRLGLAFTGSFDGNGHTISNLKISRTIDDSAAAEDMTGTGLFGGVAGSAYIHDLIIENANVSSNGNCTAALVGMAMSTPGQRPVLIENISLTGNNSISGIGSVAGLVGSAQDIDIAGCSAAANVIMTTAGNGAGILGGGLEGGSIVNCTAAGTVTATATMDYAGTTFGSVGVGGLAGCAFDSTEVTGCTVTNATISVGKNSIMVGGLLGYSGVVNEGDYTSDEDGFTVIKDCQVTGVTINAATGANRIGGLIGSGFCGPNYNSYYPASSAIHIINCKAAGKILGADSGAIAGSILGYAFRNSAVVSCTGNVTGTTNQVGATDAAQAVSIAAIR